MTPLILSVYLNHMMMRAACVYVMQGMCLGGKGIALHEIDKYDYEPYQSLYTIRIKDILKAECDNRNRICLR